MRCHVTSHPVLSYHLHSENDSESEYSYDSDEEGPLDFGEDGEGESGDSEMEGMDIDMEDLQRVISGGKVKKGKKGDSQYVCSPH